MYDIINRLKFVNSSFDIVNKPEYIHENEKSVHIPYPCEKSYECSPYSLVLAPGAYHIKLCAGNGGVQASDFVEGYKAPDYPYAGGCSSGNIVFHEIAQIYLYIGGKGAQGGRENPNERQHVGYNGGARGNMNDGSSGGGGATDIRIEENDVFHRILVAGGGGGGDDFDTNKNQNNINNDGKGGPGGGLEAGGWESNEQTKIPIANQLTGFSFGTGEEPLKIGSAHEDGIPPHETIHETEYYDIGGGGGGWFGGFTSQRWYEGAGGGSSFALTKTSEIPKEKVCEHTDLYEKIRCDYYAYIYDRKYQFTDVTHDRGVWYGDGFIDITVLFLDLCSQKGRFYFSFSLIYITILSLLIS